MSRFRVAALASSLLLTFAASALPIDDVPLTNWSAPPFWASSRVATDGARSARQALVLPSTPLPFVAIAPCRQYDSRSATPLLQNTPQTITLTGAPCGLPATAQAAAVNITIFNITGAAANGVFSVGVVSPPTTAWINYPSTETQRANAGVVALTAAGEIVVQINQVAGSVDFVVDVSGYYAPAGIVNSLNTLNGDVTVAAGTNVTITPVGNTLTIASAGATGPTGPAGTPGATGPTGPTLGFITSPASPVEGGPLDPFVPINGYATTGGPTEAGNSAIVPGPCALTTLFVRLEPQTDAAAGILFTLRVNGVDTTAACSIAGNATGCTASTAAPIAAGSLASVSTSSLEIDYGNAEHLYVAIRCQ